MFGETDYVEFDDWTSLTSPAAYFVELLEMLRYSEWVYGSTPTGTKQKRSLLQELAKRRPDLLNLQLSKANTLVVVRYADLVTGMLESFVANLSRESNGRLEPDNALDVSESSTMPNSMAATDWNMFHDVIDPLVSPMSVFPFNIANEAVRDYLVALDLPLPELFRRFDTAANTNGALSSFTTNLPPRLLQDALARRRAAATLGMNQQEFVAITGEAYFTREMVSAAQNLPYLISEESYGATIHRVTTADYWGVAEINRLHLIEDVLLPAARISMKDLTSILKTKFIGTHLVITVQSTDATYSERLYDMRLAVPSDRDSSDDFESSCNALQSFIRLWRRIGWSIEDLDSVLCTLEYGRSYTGRSNASLQITSDTLLDLVAVKELLGLINADIQTLLPLWGMMLIDGPTSLYRSLFCNRQLLRQYPDLHPDRFEDSNQSLSLDRNLPALLAVLSITESDLAFVLQILGLSPQSKWDLHSVSNIYRINYLCSKLSIAISEFPAWRRVFPDAELVFSQPSVTLKIFRQWKVLQERGWSMSELIHTFDNSSIASRLDDQKPGGVDTILLCANLITIHQKFSMEGELTNTDVDDNPLTETYVAEVCTQLFRQDIATTIVALIRGDHEVRVAATLDPATIQIDPLVRHKLFPTTSELRLRGLLTPNEVTIAKGANNTLDWTDAIDQVVRQSGTLLQTLCSKFSLSKPENAPFVVQPIDMTALSEEPAVVSGDLPLIIHLEQIRLSRRQNFLHYALPVLQRQKMEERCSLAMAGMIPGANRNLLDDLLRTPLSQLHPESTPLLRMTRDAVALHFKSLRASGGMFHGWFIPTTSGLHTFMRHDNSALMIHDRHITSLESTTMEFTAGQAYVAELKYAALESLAVSSGLETKPIMAFLVSQEAVNLIEEMALKVMNSITLANKERIAAEDLTALSLQGFSLLDAHIQQLSLIRNYLAIKKGSSSLSALTSLLVFEAVTAPRSSLCARISTTMSWEESVVQEVLSLRQQDSIEYTTIEDLVRMKDMVQAAKTTGFTIAKLASWTVLNSPGETIIEDQAARELQTSFQYRPNAKAAKAAASLADKKKQALIEYLLVKKPFGSIPINDSDDLFQYFLVDVNMGIEQETSRIQQAIATVQYFVQRCSIGLEEPWAKIPRTAVDLQQWSWMNKFTVWQASRRVFLYPENYIEPSLRDDKSEAFQAVESLILKSNLNQQSINDVLRQYAYKANEVAELEIQAFIWENADKFRGTNHFFARTRTAPYVYYYRQMKVKGSHAADSFTEWYPWSRMEIEIAPHEVDWDGTTLSKPGNYLVPTLYRNRLFLFIPQIILKTSPPVLGAEFEGMKLDKLAGKATMNDLTAPKYWEVKMGWVEYQNGRWSKKEVSGASIRVAGVSNITNTDLPAAAKKMPSISSFRFWVRGRTSIKGSANSTLESSKKDDIVIVDVYRWFTQPDNDHILVPLGRFELLGTQMVLAENFVETVNSDKGQKSTALPTTFNRLTFKPGCLEGSEDKCTVGTEKPYGVASDSTTSGQDKPLLAFGIDRSTGIMSKELTWTFAFNELEFVRPCGFILERKIDATVETFFGMPEIDGQIVAGATKVVYAQTLVHEVAQPLMEKVATFSSPMDLFKVLGTMPKTISEEAFGDLGSEHWHELGRANSIYNWELGFHLVSYLFERLLSTQQFDLALDIAKLVFDPHAQSDHFRDEVMADIPASLSPAMICWKFLPFKSPTTRQSASAKTIVRNLVSRSSDYLDYVISDWRHNPFDAFSVARSRPAVYMKRFLMKYIEALIAIGDEYFRQNSMESIPLALQRYIEASHLYGKAPQMIPLPTKPVQKSYNDLLDKWDDFGSAHEDLELEFPFYVPAWTSKDFNTANLNPTMLQGSLGKVTTTYFSTPPNPQLLTFGELISDRLYKIRHSLDIDGNIRRLPLFDPPLDPMQLVRASGTGAGLGQILAGPDGPMPNYRFVYLLQKAFELCADLKSQGEMYLSIKEKRDGEALSRLRSAQDLILQRISVDLKETQKRDVVKTIEVLQETRSSHVMRLSYYLKLVGQPNDKIPSANGEWQDIGQVINMATQDELVMDSQEALEMSKSNEAAELGNSATAIENIAGVLTALPNLMGNIEPMGCGATMKFDAGNVADGMMVAANLIKYKAQMLSDEGSKAARKARLIQQLQERRLQANLAGRDIKNVDKQLEQQQIKLELCDREIDMQNQQTVHARQLDEFLQTKYTNEDLYAWYDSSLHSVFRQTYLMAMQIAKSAELAFAFERSVPSDGFLASGYWDTARDGNLCAQNLYLGLKKLEHAYHSKPAHSFELTKTISLRSTDPLALLTLQETGKARFALSEVLYDMDFPGHYCRRIKSLSVTIPSIIGPHVGMCCTLRILAHNYRLTAGPSSLPYYPEDVTMDGRYKTDRIPIDAVAISHGQSDTGTFQVNHDGERYSPFEGAGAISSWSLELPRIPQFDYRTISDVLLNINYMALDGGAVWQNRAFVAMEKEIRERRQKPASALLEISRSASWSWSVTAPQMTVTLKDLRQYLPFWTRAHTWKPTFSGLCLAFSNDVQRDDEKPTAQGMTMKDAASTAIENYTVFELTAGTDRMWDWQDLVLKLPIVSRASIGDGRIWVLLDFTVIK
jgi:hypothetical protein